MHKRLVLVLVIVACVRGGVCVSQGVQGGGASRKPDLETGTVLVQVPALVTTTNSEVAGALTAADFRLKDNGVEQVVRLDQDVDRPLSLVVVLQIGGAARLMFPQYRGLATMIGTVLGSTPHRAAIVSFDSIVEGATPFAAD